MALGLSILSCLGRNSECLDMCGCPCVNSDSQAPLHEDLLRRSKPGALDISHLVFKRGPKGTQQSCCYKHATVSAMHSLYLLMSVYGSQNPQELHNEVNCKRFCARVS